MAILELAEKLKGILGESGSSTLKVDGMEISRDRGGRFIVADTATGKSKPLAELDFKEQEELENFLATLDHLSPLPIHSALPPEDLFSEAAGEDIDIQQSEAYKTLSE